MGIAVEIESKERNSWEPITPEKVNNVNVRRQSEDNLSGHSSPVGDAARIGDLDEDVGEKERRANANVAGFTWIDLNQDARDSACFDINRCADSSDHLAWRRQVSEEAARDKDVLFTDRGADNSSDLESNFVAAMAGNIHQKDFVSSFERLTYDKQAPTVSTPTPIKTPRQKKPKKKKHIPKVIRDGKPRRTPKRKDPGSATPSATPKKKKKNPNDSGPTPDATPLKDAITDKCHSSFEPPRPGVKSCRRHLDFGADHIEDGKAADPVQPKRDNHIVDLTSSQVAGPAESKSSSQVAGPAQSKRDRCKRVNRKSECLNKIRRMGWNFPIKFKRLRTGRKKRTAATKMSYMLCLLHPRDFYVSCPRDLKKKRTMKNRNASRFRSTVETADPIGFKSEAGEFAEVDQQTPDGTAVKGREKPARRPKVPKGNEEAKAAKRKLQQELTRIIQKIKDLNIGDVENQDAGILVLFKVKKKKKTKKEAPRVQFDPETIQMYKQLLLVDNGGGAGDEAGEDPDGKLGRDREVFRGRIQLFLARMHLILGDRQFTFWKGSVVLSVVGVYLTQNVSDNLSSNACMSLASMFPLHPVNGEQNGDGEIAIQEIIGSDLQPIDASSGDKNPRNIQADKIRESHNMSEQIEGKEEMLRFQDDIKREKGHAGRQASVSEEKKNEANKREKKRKSKAKEKETDPSEWLEWENLRRSSSSAGPRSEDHMDFVDWDAVRLADVNKLARAIKERGQHNQLAARIQNFLNELVRKQGSIDLEWLRNCPPEKAKEYLLKIPGLGLKSVECIRLLALQHVAFPVDTNVARIAVRLGWVPLEPLPGNLQIHLLDQFPVMDQIQEYLWPRLRELDHRTLYELHYHLITFGKVFCRKKNPNCNACPMRGECLHFASASASARLSLPTSKATAANDENTIVRCNGEAAVLGGSAPALGAIPLPKSECQTGSCEPIVEEPSSPEVPSMELLERDIEDFYCDDGDEIPFFDISSANFSADLQSDVGSVEENSRALVHVNDPIPMPKLKKATRLRTEHYVYELPDSHPLIRDLPKREADDPCPYLLLIRTEEKAADSSRSHNGACDSCLAAETCDEQTCQEEIYPTIKGTLLIPCRTSLRATFPLNGTYFQVNEVFADHESSLNPIDVPRRWIWNLPRRIVYFGTSATSIFKELTLEKIQSCFRYGFICVRGIDRKTGYPKSLITRFHQQPYKASKLKKAP